jgi:hypothetical protein
MATTRNKQQLTSGVVVVQRYEDGKKVGQPEYTAAGAEWVEKGIANGTVKLVEEVPADASQVPAQGDAAGAGSSGSA